MKCDSSEMMQEDVRDQHKRKVQVREKESVIATSVAKMLQSDRKYISESWQRGVVKKRKKKEMEPKISPKQTVKMRNGLNGWKRASQLFPLNDFSTFADFHLDERLLQTIGFSQLTLLQKSVIPSILDGHDVLMGSGPKSGKKLAYLIPILHKLTVHDPKLHRGDGTHVVILCQDLEQCAKLHDLLMPMITKSCWWLTSSVFAGGENRNHEKARLRKGVNVIITTESRLLDHLENTSALKIDNLKFFIIEEAGQLLALKRGAKLRRLNQCLQQKVALSQNPRIQNIISASSLHSELAFLARCILRDPISVGFALKTKSDPCNRQWEIIPDENHQIQIIETTK